MLYNFMIHNEALKSVQKNQAGNWTAEKQNACLLFGQKKTIRGINVLGMDWGKPGAKMRHNLEFDMRRLASSLEWTSFVCEEIEILLYFFLM